MPVLLAIAFAAGLLTGELLRLAIRAPEPASERIDVADMLRVRDLDAIDRTRVALAELIWGDGFPEPNDLPVLLAGTAAPSIAAVDSVRHLAVEMDSGFVSNVLHYRPADPIDRAVIYHRGHEEGSAGLETIGRLLDSGYDVVAVSMPLHEPNNVPRLELESLGPIPMLSHGLMQVVPMERGSWLKFFIHPVTAVVNYLEAEGFDEVAMIGFSGGAWTTTIAAALDPRIRRSYPVAGSLPIALRQRRDVGDEEQLDPDLLRTANYVDLYVMGSAGEGRSQLQIVNTLDSCCFAGYRHQHYAPFVAAVAASMDGRFAVFADDTHRDHIISDAALDQILTDLADWP